MGLGDLYAVSSLGNLFGQEIRNVWQYEAVHVSASAPDLTTRFTNQVLTPMAALVADNLSWLTVEARNLFDPLDYSLIPVSVNGAKIGEVMPPFTNIAGLIAHNNPTIRDGRKAIAGIIENDVADGMVGSSELIAWDTFWADEVVPGVIGSGATGQVYSPVVIKRIKYIAPSGKTAYRFPTNIAEAEWGTVTGIITSIFVRSQNSRKFTG